MHNDNQNNQITHTNIHTYINKHETPHALDNKTNTNQFRNNIKPNM